MVLDNRLSAIIAEINGGVIADVGCDHGKVSVMASKMDSVTKVYALDISPSSLQKVIVQKELNGLDKIYPMVSDGLKAVKTHIDQVIIAGMGGNEIIKILSNEAHLPESMILVPHQDAHKVRAFLSGKVCIKKDFVVQESGKFYPIIVTEKGSTTYNAEELTYGKNMPKTQDYLAMLCDKRTRYTRLVAQNNFVKSNLTDKLKEIAELCKQLEI